MSAEPLSTTDAVPVPEETPATRHGFEGPEGPLWSEEDSTELLARIKCGSPWKFVEVRAPRSSRNVLLLRVLSRDAAGFPKAVWVEMRLWQVARLMEALAGAVTEFCTTPPDQRGQPRPAGDDDEPEPESSTHPVTASAAPPPRAAPRPKHHGAEVRAPGQPPSSWVAVEGSRR